MKEKRTSYRSIWLSLLLGVVMLPIPLLGDFNIESALIAALVGCFWAALKACRTLHEATDDRSRLRFIFRSIYVAGIPLFLFCLISGCFSWHGLGFWILYPIPSVLFGYAIGRLLRKWNCPYRRIIAFGILLFIALGVLLIEFFHFPQVYFFNEVWGGWPGPIYDETVKVTWSLLLFRCLTMAWVALFWWIPAWQQSRNAKIIIGIAVLMLLAGYTHLPEMGIISPRSYLQRQLGGSKETPHFIIYYDKDSYSPDEIEFIARKQEFYYQQIADTLHLHEQHFSKVESYLYANAWQKKTLVGAKFTSYVPIWLQQSQLHIAKQQIRSSLKHELTHVLAKQFGNRLFNGSWSIGLIEGLAVALAPDISPVSTINQIVVSEKPYPSANEIKKAFSPTGFYGGRSEVNYTQSGSFVQYLLRNYPVNDFKQAYRSGNIAEAYQLPVDSLVSGWHRSLDTVKVDSTDRKFARALYNIPSLFEQKCPHVQSQFSYLWDRFQFFMTEKDTMAALPYLDKAWPEAPKHPFIKNEWAFLNLKVGRYSKVQKQVDKADSSIDALLLYADAFALTGKSDKANHFIERAKRQLEQNPDSVLQMALHVREDAGQWTYYRQLIYQHKTVSDSTFSELYSRTQARTIQQTIDEKNWPRLKRYAHLALTHRKNAAYFDTYIQLIEWLAFNGDGKLAKQWIIKLKSFSLRKRYLERLNETENWIDFVKK